MSEQRAEPRCPRPGQVQAYVVRALPDEQMLWIHEHLLECGACRMLSEGFEQTASQEADAEAVTRLWRRLEPEVAAARERSRIGQSRRRWVWIAAPLAAAAALIVMLPGARHEAGAPPAPTPKAEKPDTGMLAKVEPAPLQLPLEDLLVTRGAGTPRLSPELTSAFQAYQEGRYGDAVRRFGLLDAKVRSFERYFYEGISYLMLGQAGEAVQRLARAREIAAGDRVHDAIWYLAVARLKSNDLAAARLDLAELCGTDSQHSREACEVLQKLR